MALVKKVAAGETTRALTTISKDSEAQPKRARTLAKQQQISRRIAAAASDLASGISEAASAVEELKRSTQQIAAGAEEASGASQQCLSAFKQVAGAIKRRDKEVISQDREHLKDGLKDHCRVNRDHSQRDETN